MIARRSFALVLLAFAGCSAVPAATTDAAAGADAAGTDVGLDAGLDAPAIDAPAPDASIDAGGCSACLTALVAWGTDGGLSCSRDSSEVAPCRAYTHRRVAEACGPPDLSCTNEVPACSPTGVGVPAESLIAALAHADVVAALAAAPVLYGTDPRPMDGTVRWFTVGGSAHVEVGPGGTIPAGVSALVSLLDQLDTAQLARVGCVEVFPSP